MRRCSRRSSTSWSAAAPGANCRPVSAYRSRRLTVGSSSGREPASGAASMRLCCTGSTTPASSTSPASSSTPPTSGLKRGRPHRSEPRGPGKAGFEDAHLVGRERTAPSRRRLGRQHPRQRRAEAHDRGSPNETRPPPRPPLQAPAPARGQSLRPRRPAEMVTRQAHRSSDRTQRNRVQRTIGPPPGDRTHHVAAVRLPPTQPTLRTQSPQLPRLSRPRRRHLLLQTACPPHHDTV